jgi:hypothetical protein
LATLELNLNVTIQKLNDTRPKWYEYEIWNSKTSDDKKGSR